MLSGDTYNEFKEKGAKLRPQEKADSKMLRLLYQAKDRSASLYRSLETLQILFEVTKPFEVDEPVKESIVDAFLVALFRLCRMSLKPLNRIFHEFMRVYPANFEKFCEESEGRSNWLYFFKNRSSPYTPGNIAGTLEKEESSLDEPGSKEVIFVTLARVSRALALGAYWLEDTVDDLIAIGLEAGCDIDRKELDREEPELKEIPDVDDLFDF